jgi:hypothetical protein
MDEQQVVPRHDAQRMPVDTVCDQAIERRPKVRFMLFRRRSPSKYFAGETARMQRIGRRKAVGCVATSLDADTAESNSSYDLPTAGDDACPVIHDLRRSVEQFSLEIRKGIRELRSAEQL